MIESLDASISQAESFLLEVQLPSGEFATYRSESPDFMGEVTYDPSPFVTTFVATALGGLASDHSKDACAKAVGFLLSEREESGLWRYWSSENAATIDPDVDVTCCVAAALRALTQEQQSGAVDSVLLENRNLRGLFKTWLRPGHSPNDIALGVNANALYYFGEREETLPALQHINAVVNADKEEGSDWYYPEPATIHYLIARAYHAGVSGLGECQEALVRKTRNRLETSNAGDGALGLALSLNTALYCGARDLAGIESVAQTLIKLQRDDGSWPAHAFYAGPEPPGPYAYWWGSEELTTALVMEALTRLRAR